MLRHKKFYSIPLDSYNSTEFLVLSKLPCSLVLRQLWMFVMKHWNSLSAISANGAFIQSFKAIVDIVLFVVKEERRESWERTVSAALSLATNVVNMPSENSGNKVFFIELMRTITEVLRVTFDQLRETQTSRDMMEPIDVTKDDRSVDDVAKNSDVDNLFTNDDDTTTDVIHKDVISVIDRTCAKNEKINVQDSKRLSARLIKKVFVHDTFIKVFCCTSNSEKDDPWLSHVYRILSNCIAYLMTHFRGEILQKQNLEYLDEYFIRVSQAVKETIFRRHIAGKRWFIVNKILF